MNLDKLLQTIVVLLLLHKKNLKMNISCLINYIPTELFKLTDFDALLQIESRIFKFLQACNISLGNKFICICIAWILNC